jgi:hypothetical protein
VGETTQNSLVDHPGIEELVQVGRTAGHIARPDDPAPLERLAAHDLTGDVWRSMYTLTASSPAATRATLAGEHD